MNLAKNCVEQPMLAVMLNLVFTFLDVHRGSLSGG